MATTIPWAGAVDNAGGGTVLTIPTNNSVSAVWLGALQSNTTNNFLGDAYGNGYWVAVGDSGTIRYATDPTGSWSTATSNTTASLFGVVYDNGYWVAVGASGTIRYATDPTGSWSTATSNTTAQLEGIAYGNGYWVATGGTVIRYATDPSTSWSSATPNSTSSLYGVVYDNGYWVAVGASGTIRYATDPTGSWSTATSNTTANLFAVYYATGYWVAVGGGGTVRYATDPTGSWSTATSNAGVNLFGLSYANSYWVLVGDSGTIRYATDPTGSWSTATSNTTNQIREVEYDGTRWVAVGGVGTIRLATDTVPDALIVSVSCRAADTAITDPSGWTRLLANSSTTALGTRTYWVPASAISTNTVDVALSSSLKASASVVALKGNRSTAPSTSSGAEEATGQANASSLTVTYPTLGTFASASGIDLALGSYAHLPTATAPTNYTQLASGASSGGGANSNVTSAVAYRAVTGVTTVAQLTALWTGTAGVNIGHHVFVADAVLAAAKAPRRVLAAVMRAASW